MQKGDVKKASALMMCTVFVGFLILFVVGFITSPFQGVNYTENRMYAPLPEFSFEKLRSGEYRNELENYLSDHILGRPTLITLKSDLGLVFGRTVPSSIYRCSSGQYCLRTLPREDEGMKITLDSLKRFAEGRSVPVDMLLMPNSELIYKDLLPVGAVNEDQYADAQMIIESLKSCMNIYYPYEKLCRLRREGMQVYYKTDHHWTTDCAKAILEWYMEESGQEIIPVQYEEEFIHGFYGSLYSGSPSFFAEPDDVKYLINPKGEYDLQWRGDQKKSDSLYDYSLLMGLRNRYDIFLGGDTDRLIINSNAPRKQKLLVIGDSYSFPVIAMMADQYSEIKAINITCFENETKNIEEYIGDYEPDRILFVDLVSWITCGKLRHIY